MIQIKSTPNRNLNILADSFYDSVSLTLFRRISKITGYDLLKEFLYDNMYKVITGTPYELDILNKRYSFFCRKSGYSIDNANKKLKVVFNYNWLSGNKRRSYTFAKDLGVNTCPYCNRNYTVTVHKKLKGIVRPDFDHFFPKSKFPLLGLSFFNLIPSCPLCNRSVKRSRQTVYGKYIHPYEEGFESALKINYKARDPQSMLGIKKNLEINVILSSSELGKARKCDNNFRLFKLKEIYETSHLDEIADIIRKFHISGGRYLEILHNAFTGLGSVEELYKIAFANNLREIDFENRPLSKMTRDVVDQLNFVLPGIVSVI